MNSLLLLILILKLDVSLSGTSSIKNLMDLCLEEFLFGIRDKRFTFFPTAAGLHHYFLDTFYKQYFLENSNEMRQKMAGRIAIYTHIYLLERKIEQNKEKFEKIDANLIMEGQLAGKVAPGTVSVYDKLSGDIQRVLNVPYHNFSKYALSPGAIRQMCYLLLIKHGLLIASNFDSKIHVPDKKPSCYDLEVAYQSVLQRDEQISEWILSDLMMFLPKRPKFNKFLEELFERKKIEEIFEFCAKFKNLLGFPRMVMLFSAYPEKLGIILNFQIMNNFFTCFYQALFCAKDETSKWRAKISLEKILYDEILLKALEEQTKTLTELDENSSKFMHLQAQLKLVDDLSYWWSLYSKSFWLHEKTIVKLIKELPKQNWRKASKAKELLIDHRNRLVEMAKEYETGKEESLMHLFENGPVDVSLPRALAFCVPVALAEFGNISAARQTHQWLENLQSVQIKMLICVGRHLKSANRRDEIMAKLHLEKMMAILEEENDETDGPFKGILINHKESFGTILNKDGIQKINEWLNLETKYFSLNEKFSSAASSSDDEQRFKDANYDEQIDEDNESNNPNDSDKLERNKQKEMENSRENLKNENFEMNYFMGGQNQEENKWKKGREKIEQKNYNKKKYKWSKKESEKMEKEKRNGKKETEREENSEEKEEKENKGMERKENSEQIGEKQNEKKRWREKEEIKRKKLLEKKEREKEERSKKWMEKEEKEERENEERKERKWMEKEKKEERVIKRKKNLRKSEKGENYRFLSKESVKAMKQIKIENYSDLLNEKYLAKFYDKFLLNELEEENCVIYLHVAAFVRAIHSKSKFIKIRTKNHETKISKSFEEKWRTFAKNAMPTEGEQMEIELQKLFSLDIALNEIIYGPIEQKQMEKAIEMLEEKRKGKSKNKLGTYKRLEIENILEQLHLQIFGILCAKKLTNFVENEKIIIGERIKLIMRKENGEKEFLKKYVAEMETMLKQQKLAINNSLSSVYERSQYRLIRTSAESLEKDLKMSQEINEFIEPYSIKQSKRAEIGDFNGQIQKLIEEWVQNIPIANTDDKKVPKAKILRNGSFLMNSELDGSDLDLICVVPDQINISHFHSYNGDNLYSLLKRKITDGSVSWRPGRVPLIRIERGQIEADLLLVPVPDKNLSDEADLDQLATDQMITELKTESGIYSLAGYQSAKFQMALVQSESMLSSLLKIVKVWAKTRLIYSGLFGFFNGITLSIMATQICVLFPNSPVSFLLFQFFEIYAKWDWPNVPIMLKQLTPNKLNKIVGRFWPPIFLGQSLQSSMTIITPSFPEQNAAFNVNPFTMRTIIEELKIASEILAENPQNWERIFKEINYEEKFEHFALIVCSQSVGFDFDSYSSNCAYQKSRLRQNLLGWVNSVQAQLDNYHQIPKFEQKTICYILKEKSFCTFWLLGLSLKREFTTENENLNGLVPIYQQNHSNSPRPKHFLMSSFFTSAQKLHKMIDQLKHLLNESEEFDENVQNEMLLNA